MKTIFWILFIVADLVGGYAILKTQFTFGGTSSVYASSTSAAPARTLHVLFIGNSDTYSNNLPRMITEVASSALDNDIEIDAQSITKGGASLTETLADGAASQLIASRHWDYVVLQEQSIWMLDEAETNHTFTAVTAFAAQIRAAGAKPVIYMTWIHQPGSIWYQPPFLPATQSPAHMQAAIDNDTSLLAGTVNAPVVEVGDAWAAALKDQPALDLYQTDASHPSPTGTYLAALMFYRYLTGNSLDQVSYKPLFVGSGDAAYLRRLADGY